MTQQLGPLAALANQTWFGFPAPTWWFKHGCHHQCQGIRSPLLGSVWHFAHMLHLHTERHNAYTHKNKINKDQNEKGQKGKRGKEEENRRQQGKKEEEEGERKGRTLLNRCVMETVWGRRRGRGRLTSPRTLERSSTSPHHTRQHRARARAVPQFHAVLLEKATCWVWL